MSAHLHSARLLAPFEATAIDLAHCSRLEIQVTLYEHEKAQHGFDTWPAPVQAQVRRQAAQWLERNPGIELRCISTAVYGPEQARTCLMILHYMPAEGDNGGQ